MVNSSPFVKLMTFPTSWNFLFSAIASNEM